jgi:hypothetical protein
MDRVRSNGVRTVGILAFFLILTVVLTYPMISYFSTAMPGPPWDGYQFLTQLYWFKTALFDRHVSPWFYPDIFYPFGYNWFLSETMLTNVGLGMPVTLLAGEVVTYNTLMWLSFVLSGFGAYLWAYHLTRKRTAGLVSGVAFAFCAYRMQAMSAGWPQTIGTQWVPFTFLYVERVVRKRQWRDAVLAAFFYILNCLTTWYYAFVVGLVLVVYVLVRLVPWRRTLREKALWRCALAFVLTLVLMLPAVVPMIQLWGQRQMRYTLADADWLVTSPEDYFLPSAYHSIWCGLALKWWNNRVPNYPWIVPGMVYLGAVALVLAALTKGMKENRTQRRALFSVAALGFVLSLGLSLHVRGERVYVPVPAAVEDVFHKLMILLSRYLALNPVSGYAMPRGLGVYVPLPSLFFYLYLPFFNSMRDLRRFALIPVLAVSILAGMGAARLLGQRRALVRGVILVLLLGAMLVDLCAVPLPFGMALTQPRASDEWLAQQPGDFVVAQFPLRARAFGPSMYGIATHHKKLTYGWGTFFPAGYASHLTTLDSFPSAESMSLVKSWGVKYILVGSMLYGDNWPYVEADIIARTDLKLVAVLAEPSRYVAYRPGPLTGNVDDLRWRADLVYVYEVLP